jgi:hypothetical protein
MDPVRPTAAPHNWLAVVIGAAALGAPSAGVLSRAPLVAQPRPPEIQYIIDAAGDGPDFDLRSVRHGFDLFANADVAVSGMRATGAYGTSISNYGDCDNYLSIFSCQYNSILAPQRGPGVRTAPYFEVGWVAGAPPSQFKKIRQLAPSVAYADGDGWTADYNRHLLGQPTRFGPHDGTLGRMFSGVTSAADGSCRDHTGFANGFRVAGQQLLPTSDCPETWGTDGWLGAHPIDAAGFAELVRQRGDAFGFDFWRVPLEYQNRDAPFLGTNHHTYGETSDYSAEVLANYGRVVPGGVGAPRVKGYPLGLLIRFEAFNMASPPVSDAYFVQATIVNRSADVWGAPIDYDSLYFGLAHSPLFPSSNSSAYAVPDRGALVFHNSNVQGPGGPCGEPSRSPDGIGCTGSTSTARGYRGGASAMLFLKTPIGDLRNKLFTRTPAGDPCVVDRDPFCRPDHPARGDTLTFNHAGFGNYSNALNFTWTTGGRAAFGYLANDERNTMADRDANLQPVGTLWRVFRSEFWSTKRVHYNKYVPPGGWDYNHDGILDTLALMTCGRDGCATVSSDTMPGGWLDNRVYVGGFQAAGPFSLRAGDTTSIIYAHVGSGDSASFWAQMDAVINLYLRFFLVPQAPPRVHIVSTQLIPGTDAMGTTRPEVRFFFSDTAAQWVDPALTQIATDVESDLGWEDVYALNPWLPDSLRIRARDNLERLEVYKSCDGGLTFTADSDCRGDRTADVDGSAPGLGWRAYAILPVGTPGVVPNVFTDADVQDGRTYLYVVVAKSRGATFVISTPDGLTAYEFAPSFRQPLSRTLTEPNVVSIYVPVSKQAGAEAARVRVVAGPPAGTVPFVVSPMDSVIGGTYRAVFGNELVVEEGALASTERPVPALVTIRRRELVGVGGAGVDSVIASSTFVGQSRTFPVAGTGVVGPPVTRGDTVWTPTTYAGLGFVVVGDAGPIFGSATLTGAAATPSAVFGLGAFPGFVISASQDSANVFAAGAERQVRGPQALADLPGAAPSDTVVQRTMVEQFMVQWQEVRSTKTADGGGLYRITWADDPFAVSRGLTLNLANPATTEAELLALLEGRVAADTGATDAATASLIGINQLDLVALRVPFTITNLTYGRPVDLAMPRRISNRIVLGSGPDTISVAVPGDVWVPGDALTLLETIEEDSATANGLVLDAQGRPVRSTPRVVTFGQAVLGCATPRLSCNPVLQGTTGATGYHPIHAGDRTEFSYYVGLRATDSVVFEVAPPVTGTAIPTITDSAMARIRVVPNPFMLFSTYQTSPNRSRLLFTHVPPEGTLRIYTVAGQFVQQITWVPADLQGDGDLVWNLTTRFGEIVASGLYVWVLTAPRDPGGPPGPSVTARGKFVVIRGESY